MSPQISKFTPLKSSLATHSGGDAVVVRLPAGHGKTGHRECFAISGTDGGGVAE